LVYWIIERSMNRYAPPPASTSAYHFRNVELELFTGTKRTTEARDLHLAEVMKYAEKMIREEEEKKD
jgi:hypothetical protein